MRSLKRTLILKIDPKHPDGGGISLGAKILKEGGLVAFPTETVYGLAANLLNDKAIARLYKVKRRPRSKPFTVHIRDVAEIRKMGCAISGKTKDIVNKFWPGPLTIILKSKSGKNIGFRMPDNEIALELIKKAGVPIVAPSANISGRRPPTSANEVLEQLNNKIDMVIDGGCAKVGVESTVLDLTGAEPRILREGAIKKRTIVKVMADE